MSSLLVICNSQPDTGLWVTSYMVDLSKTLANIMPCKNSTFSIISQFKCLGKRYDVVLVLAHSRHSHNTNNIVKDKPDI